jgi:Rps23 Pro-64 3,4-dihydroxylase Tpa1-like proline 4-hydroxylase
MLRPLDREKLKAEFAAAKPFPYLMIDSLIDQKKAAEIAAAYPSFEAALGQGRTFLGVNERKKIQITDSSKYPASIAELNEVLASASFLAELSYLTGIPNLIADEQLVGGGMHMTGPGGRLDVHVDFNYMQDRKLHRRVNLLLYLNSSWDDAWGGQLQLWDQNVEHCEAEIPPLFNRCVIFETSEISYHGVVPVSPRAPFPRKSFATYYYTREAPAGWNGVSHSTIFRARPDEKLKARVLMPAEKAKRGFDDFLGTLKAGVKRAVRR